MLFLCTSAFDVSRRWLNKFCTAGLGAGVYEPAYACAIIGVAAVEKMAAGARGVMIDLTCCKL